MIDLAQTIAPKSDQLNADDLISGPKTIRVTRVSLCAEPEQPIAINFEGDNGKPYKPCKSMRRVLVTVWGPDGSAYIGRSMTLYRDETVTFGNSAVGGVRISHLSNIEKPIVVALTVKKSVRKPFQVKPLATEPPAQLKDVLEAIAESTSTDELNVAGGLARKLATQAEKDEARQAFVARKAELAMPLAEGAA